MAIFCTESGKELTVLQNYCDNYYGEKVDSQESTSNEIQSNNEMILDNNHHVTEDNQNNIDAENFIENFPCDKEYHANIEDQNVVENDVYIEGRNEQDEDKENENVVENVYIDDRNEQDEDKENQKNKFKKRKLCKESWTRNIRKRKLNLGEAHSNTRSRWVEGKKMKEPCDQFCKFKCTSNINERDRHAIFTNYWQMGDINRQRDFLIRHMEKVEPKYRRHKVSSDEIRDNNNKYYFEVNGVEIRVCKKYFLNTLSISDQTTRTALQKMTNKNGILDLDQRGRHTTRKNRISDEIKNDIRRHIESIPTIESHYLRAQTTRKYFEGSLDLATLYRLYKEKCTLDGTTIAHYFQYAHIFNYEYNIGFYNPKKDQCTLCATFMNSSEEEKLQLQDKFDNHIRNKELCRSEKKEMLLKD